MSSRSDAATNPPFAFTNAELAFIARSWLVMDASGLQDPEIMDWFRTEKRKQLRPSPFPEALRQLRLIDIAAIAPASVLAGVDNHAVASAALGFSKAELAAFARFPVLALQDAGVSLDLQSWGAVDVSTAPRRQSFDIGQGWVREPTSVQAYISCHPRTWWLLVSLTARRALPLEDGAGGLLLPDDAGISSGIRKVLGLEGGPFTGPTDEAWITWFNSEIKDKVNDPSTNEPFRVALDAWKFAHPKAAGALLGGIMHIRSMAINKNIVEQVGSVKGFLRPKQHAQGNARTP